MKKILVFIDWYLPGYKAGGPIRSMVNMVAHLSDKIQFHIVTTNTDYLEAKPYTNIKSNEWNQLSENEYVYYFSKEKLSRKSLKEIIDKTDFDIVYINGIYSLYFSILPLIFAKKVKNKKVIVASRGMLSEHSLGVKSLKKKVFVAAAKFTGFYQKITIQVTSITEKKEIKELKLRQKNIVLIPNLPPKAKQDEIVEIYKEAGVLNLVSIARIAPEKNTLFALECLSKIKFEGNIQFDLYGAVYQEDYWNKCKDLINTLPSNIKVNYKGEIHSQLINDTLSKYHFSFLPSKGENFGHSILESLLAGRPVIISNTTPWKKLEEHNAGWDIELSKPEIFAEKINLALALDDSPYKAMMKNALNYGLLNSKLDETRNRYYELFS